MTKLDVHGHEERYKHWKSTIIIDNDNSVKSIEDDLTKVNSDIFIKYLFDMEIGANVGKNAKKGPRGYLRLNTVRTRLKQIFRWLQKRGIDDVTTTTARQIMGLFNDIREGGIKTVKGEKYSERSNADYAEVFSSFFHWWIRINRKEGREVSDITEDLSKQKEESKFVWITKDEFEKMLPYFSEDEQVMLLFVFDSLIRAPTELMSLKVKDVFERDGNVWVNIPKEITKTGFSRTLNLLYSGEPLIKYIRRRDAGAIDYLFDFSYREMGKKIQQVAARIFKNRISQGGEYFNNMTLYDLRHSGAIHLRILAQKTKKISLDAIRQRGGWKDFDMLNYYTRFLGLTGEIDKNDLLIEQDKSQLEKEIEGLKKNNIEQMEAVRGLKTENRKTVGLMREIFVICNALLDSSTKDSKGKRELLKYFNQLPLDKAGHQIVLK